MVCPLCYGRGYVDINGSTSLGALVWCWCMVCGEIYVHDRWNLGKAKCESCTITFQQVFQHVMNWNSLNLLILSGFTLIVEYDNSLVWELWQPEWRKWL